jgi:hypothetical protein
MPNTKDFYDLRETLQTMADTARDALQFLDRQGLAGGGRKTRVSARGVVPADPDGKHVTMEEAAKILGVSDSAVRLWWKSGILPTPTFERRNESHPRARTQVLPRDAVEALAASRNA